MFKPKGFFSEVACPLLNECHIPQCIFSHHVSVDTKSSTNNPDEIALSDHDDDQRGQRKRQKLNDQVMPSKSIQTIRSKATSRVARPISPPPLRRKPVPAAVARSMSKSAPEVLITVEALRPRRLEHPPAKDDLRCRLVQALHEQFTRLNAEVANDASDAEKELVLSDQALITKTLDLEIDASGSAIYSNVLKSTIMLYKRMSVNDWVEERKKDIAKTKAVRNAISISTPKALGLPVSLESGLGPDHELKLLPHLYSNIENLPQSGFNTEVYTESQIDAAKVLLEAAQGWEECERCRIRFQVFPGRREEDGLLASGGQCTYHHGKLAFNSAGNKMDPKAKRIKRWSCCGEILKDSNGCTHAPHHVFKINKGPRLGLVWNFERTPANLQKTSDRPVCVDAEMGYTVYGLELLRLTATSWPSGDEIFDILVKPMGGILDLNSRWSGIYPEDMAEALPWSTKVTEEPTTDGIKKRIRMVESPQAARDLLFSHISPQTPLIGHGLENDFIAVRIIHPTFIDTSLLFPHAQGLPFRNRLKNLMKEKLRRDIQVVVEGEAGGHDSKEDANAAGDLVRFALKKEWEKMKKEGWTLKDGEFKPPTPKEPFLLLDGGHYFNVRETGEEIRVPTGPRKRVEDHGGEGRALGSAVPAGSRKRSRAEAIENLRSSSPVALSRPQSMSTPDLDEEQLEY